MHNDPVISVVVAAIFCILTLSILMKKLKQPHVLAYLIVGIIFGPNVLNLVSDQASINRLGSFGVILLLFFIGMEVSPRRLVDNWVVSVLGTLLQVLVSVLAIAVIGIYLDWGISRIVLLGFVVSLSSTAVVLKLLEDWKELNTRVGQNVLGILLVQDLVIVPMLIIIGFLDGNTPSTQTLYLQAIGGLTVILLSIWLVIKEEIRLPWLRYFGSDHEMQTFTSLGICFGMALLTSITELSTALGAFVGGMVVSSAKETDWVYKSLSTLRTIFIALFFVSIGMLLDLRFITANLMLISTLVVASFIVNQVINGLILKFLGEDWRVSLYGGALLSQIGEFSFIIASVGFQMNIINAVGYQTTISVIVLTLFFSPLWIAMVKYLTNFSEIKLEKA